MQTVANYIADFIIVIACCFPSVSLTSVMNYSITKSFGVSIALNALYLKRNQLKDTCAVLCLLFAMAEVRTLYSIVLMYNRVRTVQCPGGPASNNSDSQ